MTKGRFQRLKERLEKAKLHRSFMFLKKERALEEGHNIGYWSDEYQAAKARVAELEASLETVQVSVGGTSAGQPFSRKQGRGPGRYARR